MSTASTNRPPRQRLEEKERYYLFPGQGGSNYRRKQRVIVRAAIAVGLLVSMVFAFVAYAVHSHWF